MFIKQVGLGAAGLGVLGALPIAGFARGNGLNVLPRSTPEEQGVSSLVISKFLDAVKDSGQEFHSIMIVRHGYVIAEGWWYPYSKEHRQQLYSLSKSFTGTAIGYAVSEGLLTVEDPVIQFFKDEKPAEISDNLAALKVKHLLSMSVGHGKDSIMIIEKSPAGTPWAKTFLSLPVVFPPGSQFMYNSGASFMLSAIITKLTGKTAHEYLKPRLYEPLEITNATWGQNPDGINMGASHLRMRTEDIAKFGQLYLQNGVWKGEQVLRKDWVATAQAKHIDNGKNDSSWGYGYGYQFWLNPPGGYRADGAFGQYCMILPDEDAVVAITSESPATKTTMQMVWDILVPEMKAPAALPKDQAAQDSLKQTLGALAYEPPKYSATSLLSQMIEFKEYVLEPNPFNAKSVSFRFANNTCVFILKTEGKPDIVITHGIQKWIREGNLKPEAHSLFSLRRIDFDSIVAASATWISDNALLLTWRFIETVHGDSLTFTFEGDNMTNVNIRFLFSANRLNKQPDDRADIKGTARNIRL
jgi:CubicO group peptidase (beta-lactamase class C family)